MILGAPRGGFDTIVKLPGKSLVTIPTWTFNFNLRYCWRWQYWLLSDLHIFIKSKSGKSQFWSVFHLRLFKELCVYVVKLLPKTECPSNMKTSMSNNISGLYRRAHKLYLNFYAKLFLWCLHLQSFQLFQRYASPHLVWLPNTQPTCCCEWLFPSLHIVSLPNPLALQSVLGKLTRSKKPKIEHFLSTAVPSVRPLS